MRTAKTDCGAASYAWVGRERGRPLLMLNGTGSPASEWDPALLARLGRERRLLVFDYPGLGGSMSLPRVSFNVLARCAAKLARKVHDGPIDVLGWSMGGFVAQRLAVQSPKLVRRLVLVSTNPGGRPAVLGPEWVQKADSNPGPALKAYVRSNYPRGYRDLGWAFLRRLDNAERSHRYPRSRVPRKVFRAMVRAETPWLKSNRNGRDLRGLRVPTLVMVGADDVITPPANARRIAKRIPRSQLVVMPHAGHSVLFAYPSQTAHTIADFLR